MISAFQIVLLALLAWMGFRLWQGTSSPSARGVTLGALVYVGWSLLL